MTKKKITIAEVIKKGEEAGFSRKQIDFLVYLLSFLNKH